MFTTLARFRVSIQRARSEIRYLFSMASTWQERLSITKFVLYLYLARAMPFDTYHWNIRMQLHGARYLVGVRTSEIYVFDEIYGERMYDRRREYMPRDGSLVLDLGANIGIFTVLAAKRGASVHAFEPNPASFERMSWTIEANKLGEQAHLVNSAVGNRIGSANLQVARGGTTGGTVLTEPFAASDPVLPVSMITLDSYTSRAKIEHIDLLKMDVEGAEVDVLRGATKTLNRTSRVIAEYHSKDLLRDFEDILRRHGFVRELRFTYYPEDLDHGIEEVGMIYLRRSEDSVATSD